MLIDLQPAPLRARTQLRHGIAPKPRPPEAENFPRRHVDQRPHPHAALAKHLTDVTTIAPGLSVRDQASSMLSAFQPRQKNSNTPPVRSRTPHGDRRSQAPTCHREP